MNAKDAVLAALKELILPELQTIKREQAEFKMTLGMVNKRLDSMEKRLDDMNAHLVDQSRRIDETNKRIDKIHADLILRIDETNRSIARLYEVIVRREEHQSLLERVARLELTVEELRKHQVA